MKKSGIQKIYNLAAAATVAAPLAFGAAAFAQDGARFEPVPGEQFSTPAADAGEISAEPQTGGGDLSYLFPLALLGLGTLPALWWLRKITPPQPTNYDFPAIRIFEDLTATQVTPAETPVWQLLMCMSLASAAIVAFADPRIDPAPPLAEDRPMLLVIDDSYGAADDWKKQQKAKALELVSRAERQGVPVRLLMCAPPEDGGAMSAGTQVSAAEARRVIEALAPKPWACDRETAMEALRAVQGPASVFWLSDSLNSPGTELFADALAAIGPVEIFEDPDNAMPLALMPPDMLGREMRFTVKRPQAGSIEIAQVAARAEDGRIIARQDARFGESETEVAVSFFLPEEIRNEIGSVVIEGEKSAAAVVYLDERYRRRPVGIATDASAQPGTLLLSENYYLEQALEPYAAPSIGTVGQLLENGQAVLIVADSVFISKEEREKIDTWVREGGMLVRFAGPNVAQNINDSLLPIPLREGERNLGGALSWDEPRGVAPFEESSPFAGIDIPENVVVKRQVLAQPGVDITERAWASLEDGTPLVTAEQRGQGRIVLIHTTAGADLEWSNLSLSGLYIDMLRAVITHSQGLPGLEQGIVLPPWKTLDGQGRLGEPSAATRPLTSESVAVNYFGPYSPPGLYGDVQSRKAHNLSSSITAFQPLPEMPAGVLKDVYKDSSEIKPKGFLLGSALALLLADLLIVLNQRGLLSAPGAGRRRESPNAPKGPSQG